MPVHLVSTGILSVTIRRLLLVLSLCVTAIEKKQRLCEYARKKKERIEMQEKRVLLVISFLNSSKKKLKVLEKISWGWSDKMH